MSTARNYLTHPDSVQVKYRPVVQLGDKIPDPPEHGDVDSPAALWWAEQHLRCRKGWTADDGTWFNPMYYWYLNFVKIEYPDPKTKRDVIEAPLYIDSDHEIFNAIWFCLSFGMPREIMMGDPHRKGVRVTKKEKELMAARKAAAETVQEFLTLAAKDLVCVKGRRKHWSFVTFCGVLPWLWCVDPSGHLGCGFDEKSSREEGQRIFRGVYDRLHPFWKHEALYTDREGELSPLTVRYDDEGRKIEEEGYTIYFRELDRRPGALRGKRYRLVLLDEAGKYLNLKKVLGATKDTLRLGTDKTGTLLLGGTFDSITVENDDFQKEWENAKALGKKKLFIQAWKCAPNTKGTSVDWFTGQSIESVARADYMAERQMYIDAGDMEQYAFCVQESPLDDWELFSSPSQSQYPASTLIAQTQRIAELRPEQLPIRGRYDYVTNGYGVAIDEVEFFPDPNGYWWVHPDARPHPDLENIDTMGIDDVYKDIAPHSSSLCGISIRRRFDHRLPAESGMHLAIYEHRPGLDSFSDECIKAIKFWGRKTLRVIIEDNAEYTSSKIIEAGFGDNLIWYGDSPGLRNSTSSIIAQTGLMLRWVKKDMQNCRFQRIIDGLKKWRNGNDDIASADHLCLMGQNTLAWLTPTEEQLEAKRLAASQTMYQRSRLKEQFMAVRQPGKAPASMISQNSFNRAQRVRLRAQLRGRR